MSKDKERIAIEEQFKRDREAGERQSKEESRVRIDDKGRVHAERRTGKDRRKIIGGSLDQTHPLRRQGERRQAPSVTIAGEVEAGFRQDHPGCVPMPNVKQACREAIQEDREHQAKVWSLDYPDIPPAAGQFKAKEYKQSSTVRVDPLIVAQILLESEGQAKHSGVTDVMKGAPSDKPCASEFAHGVQPDNWKHRSQAMRYHCSTCVFFVSNRFAPELHCGNCHASAPGPDGWPVVNESHWCGDHKLDEEKV